MRDELKSYTQFQKAIFDGAQETAKEPLFVPVGRCSRHPEQSTGNGMFDTPCPLCEVANDEPSYQDSHWMPVDEQI